MEKEKSFVAFDKKYVYNGQEGGRKNLRDAANRDIIVMDVEIKTSEVYGEYVILRCEDGSYYTFSKLVQKQFSYMSDTISNGGIIKAGVSVNNRGQCYLTSPYNSI